MRIHLVDGTYELFRSFFGALSKKAPDGREVGATLGLLNSLLFLLTRSGATHVACAFDHVIESAKIGLRKPDPRIYRLMVETLKVDPKNCVYLDDLGVNLKPAREMGMTTIKVVNAAQAITELEAATGLALR